MSSSSDQLTPLHGSPVVVVNKGKRRGPSRPKSLRTGELIAIDDKDEDERAPATNALDASATFGFAAAILLALTVVAFPGLSGRAKACLALLGLIYAVFYMTLRTFVRRAGQASWMEWLATAAEALAPAATLTILATLDVQPGLVVLSALSCATLMVCATRLVPYAVVVVGIVQSTSLVVTLLLWDLTSAGALLTPTAWLLAVTATLAVGTHYLKHLLVATKRVHAKRLEEELGRYLSKEVAEAILLDQHRAPEKRRVSVLFCDLRGFTFLCERERPEDVVELLNTLYDGACRIISAHGGNVNKFLGDGLLATFGDRSHGPNHTEQAANAALEMQQWIRFLRERGGIWTHVAMGIGIDTGDVVAGPIGGTNRREYTVIGPCVNRAARLQAFAERDYQRIVLSQAATDTLPETMVVRSLGTVELKGFARAETIYSLHQDSQS